MKTTKTLGQIRATILRLALIDKWTGAQCDEYEQASADLVRAGFCPRCACEAHVAPLGVYESPTAETYGGRSCLHCGEFHVTGEQATAVMDTTPDCDSDADPGL